LFADIEMVFDRCLADALDATPAGLIENGNARIT
jgi:hypothetical protein